MLKYRPYSCTITSPASFGGPEQRMLGLIDGEILGNAVLESRIGIIPSGLQFPEGNGIGPVAVDLVGRHVDKRRFRARPPGGLQHVERAHAVDFEIEKRNGRGPVVRRLRRGVHNELGA